jgi:hypothetical protein
MLISILLPTRKRFDLMIKSIISLYENANDPSRIELLLKLDDDNYKEYIDRIDEIYKITQNVKIVISNRRKGYNSLHHFVNELCGVSTGEFLLLWNDDATMITNEWDNYVVEHSGEVCVLQMDNNHFPDIFPLVHRKIYEVLGHFSLNPQNDSWIHFVAQMADIEKDEFRIIAHHDRADITGNNDDEVYRGGIGSPQKYSKGWELLHSQEQANLRAEDISKILKYLYEM